MEAALLAMRRDGVLRADKGGRPPDAAWVAAALEAFKLLPAGVRPGTEVQALRLPCSSSGRACRRKAAATAAPVPKPTQGVAALKQVKLLGFLVRPKPSTEPTAPPTAAMGGAE